MFSPRTGHRYVKKWRELYMVCPAWCGGYSEKYRIGVYSWACNIEALGRIWRGLDPV